VLKYVFLGNQAEIRRKDNSKAIKVTKPEILKVLRHLFFVFLFWLRNLVFNFPPTPG